ncbi:sulfite exporter TauE/SafE family protein [Eubacterium sp. F2]|uniref:sulfite exporter TauE/SafE family protein n=1 Tax=Eubacterium sp. F2 TaxID=3381348 RepID=UPI003907E789
MTLTPFMFLLVCPFLFLAGFVDSIAGGGGLISMPVYLLAGLPPHTAVATNKLSSTCGTALTTVRFMKNNLINLKLAVPSILAAIAGSSLGARISMSLDENILRNIIICVLPVAAFFVLNKKMFSREGGKTAAVTIRTVTVSMTAAFLIGIYDGLYGPGTGSFLIIAFTVFAHLSVEAANAQAKAINLTTNLTALTLFLLSGKVLLPLGLAGAVCNMAGNYIGSGLVMKKGGKIVRPLLLAVLVILFIRLIMESV